MPLKRVSRRDHLLAVKATLHAYDVMTGHAPREYLTPIPDKRKPRAYTGNRTEADANDDIRDYTAGRADLTLWRNNRGSVELPGGGHLRYGVGPNGSSDWIGFQSVVVTQEMVGKRVAVFVAVEAKAPKTGPSDDQIKFIDRIQAAGGKAGVARGAADVEEIVR